MLRLQKEFQGRSHDLLISYTTIVFTRYILLAWQQRCNTDERTLSGLFMHLADEFNELDWAVALTTLLELLTDISSNVATRSVNLLIVNFVMVYGFTHVYQVLFTQFDLES